MSMRIDEICTYGPKSGIKAGEATKDGQYVFFTSSEDESKRYTDYQYDGEGIIMGTGGNATLHYYHGKYAVSTDCIVLNPDDRIRCKYLYYFFRANMPILEAGFKGAGLKHTNKKYIGSIPIPKIPPADEQDSIIEVLDRIYGIINARNLEMTALDDLIKARFVEMFGDPELNPMEWPVEALGDVLSVEPQNGLYKPQSDYVQDGTGIPILRIDAFYDGKVNDFSRLKRLNCTDTERSRYLLMENDVVINRVNSLEYLGKCAWITGLIEPTVFESNMMRFHVDESRIDPCYMTRLLCSTFIYKQILNRAKKAVNQASINQGDVQSFKILVPPIKLQKQFAAFVAQIDKSKSVIQKSLDETQLLFDSLMQQYFG